jgi:hypothetical protein
MIFVMKFQAAAMSRADVDRADRPDFCLYVDEFQNYSTDSFADIMSEARKFGLNLVVANQFTTQLSDEIRGAVFGNVGTIISLRVGIDDADFLAKQFAPVFDSDDLQRIPNFNAAVRTLINGVPTQPFSMAGLPPLDITNKELGDALKQLTAAKFGRPKAIVAKEILDRITVPADIAKKTGVEGQLPTKPAKPSTGSSFLDDWMQKKQTNSFKAPASPFNTPGSQTNVQGSQSDAQLNMRPGTTGQVANQVNQQALPPSNTPSQQLQNTAQPKTNQGQASPTQQPRMQQPALQDEIKPLNAQDGSEPQKMSNDKQKPFEAPVNQPQSSGIDNNSSSETSKDVKVDNSSLDLKNPHTNDHTISLR